MSGIDAAPPSMKTAEYAVWALSRPHRARISVTRYEKSWEVCDWHKNAPNDEQMFPNFTKAWEYVDQILNGEVGYDRT